MVQERLIDLQESFSTALELIQYVMEPRMEFTEDNAHMFVEYASSNLQNDSPEVPREHIVRSIQREYFSKDKHLSYEFVLKILQQSTEFSKNLSNVVEIFRQRSTETGAYTGRVTVVGDLHGQYRDLEHLLSADGPIGFPSMQNRVIINGDMVDRGDMSVEIVLLLSLIAVLCPGSVLMLKGNHEAEHALMESHGFITELKNKYPLQHNLLKNAFFKLFAALPVAAVIDGAVFVVHGGLGRCTWSIDQINRINRFIPPVRGSILHELLWNDPIQSSDQDGIVPGQRSCNEAFGPTVTSTFLADNNLQLLVRSHQHCKTGIMMHHRNACFTVFSAPNYTGSSRNQGAILRFACPEGSMPCTQQFEAHHYPQVVSKFSRDFYRATGKKHALEATEDEELQLALKESLVTVEEDWELQRALDLSMRETTQLVIRLDDFEEEEEKAPEFL